MIFSLFCFAACGKEEGKQPDNPEPGVEQEKPNDEQKPQENPKPDDENPDPGDENPDDEQKPQENPKPDEENPDPDDEDPDDEQKPNDREDPKPDDQEQPKPDDQEQPKPDDQEQKPDDQKPSEDTSADDNLCLGPDLEMMLNMMYGAAVNDFAKGMAKLSDAGEVQKTISITSGNLVVYTLEETYTKGEGEYTCKQKEKRLNGLDSDTPYTETENTSTSTTAGSYAKALDFSLKDFRDMPIISFMQDELTASFSKNIAKRIFGIEGDISTVNIHMKRMGDKVTLAEFSFSYGEYDIKITILGKY